MNQPQPNQDQPQPQIVYYVYGPPQPQHYQGRNATMDGPGRPGHVSGIWAVIMSLLSVGCTPLWIVGLILACVSYAAATKSRTKPTLAYVAFGILATVLIVGVAFIIYAFTAMESDI